MNSMGPDPCYLKVFPFDKCLCTILEKIQRKAAKYLQVQEKWKNYKLKFNCLEIQFYFGTDICRGIKGFDKKNLGCNCNKTISYHNDCQFDDGTQSNSDSVSGNHPIVTISFGSTRQLKFLTTNSSRNGRYKEKMILTFSIWHTIQCSCYYLMTKFLFLLVEFCKRQYMGPNSKKMEFLLVWFSNASAKTIQPCLTKVQAYGDMILTQNTIHLCLGF